MTLLPVHPYLTHPRTGEPLRAVYRTKAGRLVWPQLGGSQPTGEPPAPAPAPAPAPPAPQPAPTTPAGDPPSDPDRLGDAGKKALDEERKARKAAEAELAKYRKAEQDRADADRTEAEKRAAAEQRAAAAELRAAKVEVAHAKGLTPAQAKRLNGSTREELEADADEILRDFPTAPANPAPPAPRPDPGQGPRPTGAGATVAAGAALYEQRNKKKTTVT